MARAGLNTPAIDNEWSKEAVPGNLLTVTILLLFALVVKNEFDEIYAEYFIVRVAKGAT